MPSIPANQHPRRDIRFTIIGILSGEFGSGNVGERIYPVAEDYVSVSTSLEEIIIGEGEGSMGELTTRRLIIEVSVLMRTNLLESTLDLWARTVEEELSADPTLFGRGRELRLERTEIDYLDDIEKPAGICTLVYGFLYACDPRTFATYLDPGA